LRGLGTGARLASQSTKMRAQKSDIDRPSSQGRLFKRGFQFRIGASILRSGD
jgi:hypothetical protein